MGGGLSSFKVSLTAEKRERFLSFLRLSFLCLAYGSTSYLVPAMELIKPLCESIYFTHLAENTSRENGWLHSDRFTSWISSTKTQQESETVKRRGQDYMAQTSGERSCKQPPRVCRKRAGFAFGITLCRRNLWNCSFIIQRDKTLFFRLKGVSPGCSFWVSRKGKVHGKELQSHLLCHGFKKYGLIR